MTKPTNVWVVIELFDHTIVGVFTSEQTARQTADLCFGGGYVSRQRLLTKVPEYLKESRT